VSQKIEKNLQLTFIHIGIFLRDESKKIPRSVNKGHPNIPIKFLDGRYINYELAAKNEENLM